MKDSKRSRTKYPGLKPRLTSRVRQEYWDFDYIDKLDDASKEFLNRFIEEELNSQFKNDGSDFSKTKEERKRIYDANNAKNRDMLGLVKGKVANTKLLEYGANIENELAEEINPHNLETAFVDYIDTKQMNEWEAHARKLDEIADEEDRLASIADEKPQESQQPLPPGPTKPQKS